MKIGILSYQSACNYGAFLQLFSTVEYLKAQGDEPRVINWIPYDLEAYYKKCSPLEADLYESLRQKYYPRTRLCRDGHDVADVIREEGIGAVIIGSDAVAQHQPLLARIIFPTKRILTVVPITSHRTYPSPFWGDFTKYLEADFPVVMMSVSSQDAGFFYIHGMLRREMSQTIHSFKYVSVRDDWTQKMFSYLTYGKITPPVTPDPVFAIGYNCNVFFPSKEDIIKKFSLPDKYILLSFKKENGSVGDDWLRQFESCANKNGIACVDLPYAESASYETACYSIPRPLSPIDWYALIKYSCGYVGNNMHPIIVSLHNSTPFYSFDNYGIVRFRGLWASNQSSKIYHIVKKSGLLANYVYARGKHYMPPKPEAVLNALLHFDKEKCQHFSDDYYKKYLEMMAQIYSVLKSNSGTKDDIGFVSAKRI